MWACDSSSYKNKLGSQPNKILKNQNPLLHVDILEMVRHPGQLPTPIGHPYV